MYTPRLRPIRQLAQSIPRTVPDYYGRKDFNRSIFSSQDTTYHAPISGSFNRGHVGYLKTIIKQLYRNFYWASKRDIRNYVAACDICQYNKSKSVTSQGLLQPLPISSRIWMDALPPPNGKTILFVVADCFK